MYNKDSFTLGDTEIYKRNAYQDVLLNDTIVAVLVQKDNGMLNPITFYIQKFLPEQEAEFVDSWIDTEDQGFIFGRFHEKDGDFGFSSFVDYMNKRGKFI